MRSFGDLWKFGYKTNMKTTLLPPQNQNEQVDIRLLHMNEVARRLGVSLQRAYELGRQGLLPIVRLGRQMRVEEHRLLAWIAEGGASLPDSLGGMRHR
jgi:excisionase family DNA binding protein